VGQEKWGQKMLGKGQIQLLLMSAVEVVVVEVL
jgi:hypothetical protein